MKLLKRRSPIPNPVLKKIAEEFGTPTYVYDQATIVESARRYDRALRGLDYSVHFAAKANSNLKLLTLFKTLNCGVDVVSGGELFRAQKAGFHGKDIVFSGVGKTETEIEHAIDLDILTINVESYDELTLINRCAERLGKAPSVSLRVNPSINAKTHRHLTTGDQGSKFGLDSKELRKIFSDIKIFSHVRFVGLSCHVGSQIQDLSTLEKAWTELLAHARTAPFDVRILDLGGGLGVDLNRTPRIEEYGKRLQRIFRKAPYHLCIEPGRSLIAESGVLLTKVLSVKEQSRDLFVVVDAGMNDFIRPALYEAEHPIWPLTRSKSQKTVPYTVVGPVCESADVFGRYRGTLPKSGDLLAIGLAGAYGMSMASEYNSRPRPAEVLVSRGKSQIIRSRGTYEELIRSETL